MTPITAIGRIRYADWTTHTIGVCVNDSCTYFHLTSEEMASVPMGGQVLVTISETPKAQEAT